VRTFATCEAAIKVLARTLHAAPTNHWTYHDDEGEERFVVVRFDPPTGKTFRPVRKTPTGWQIGDPPGPLPLYRLPEITTATRVYVTEGEKAAEAARSIGLVATTSAHGAQSPDKTDWSPLAGKDVVLLPDNDEPGLQYAKAVTTILGQLRPAARICVVELPDLPTRGDLFDFLEQRDAAEPEALRSLVEGQVALVIAESSVTTHRLPLPSVPFPLEALPEPLQGFVAAASVAMRCDPSYVALPLLAASAAAVGNTRRIQLKRGWSEPAIVWTAIVGESGTLKTPAFKLVMQPLRDQQMRAFQQHQEACQMHERASLEFDRALAAWKRSKSGDPPPEKPVSPEATRFVVSDTTVEALAPLLLANPRGLLMARDELAGWLGSFDRYTQGKRADSAHWLSMHNGETLLVDRKTGLPRTIYVPRAAVSVTGGIQPGTLARAMHIEHRESGLAARLLVAWPERQVKTWTDAEIDPLWEAELSDLFQQLLRLEPRFGDTVAFEPLLLPLTPEGRQVWIGFYNEHAREQADLDGDLSAVWSKLEGYAARLALVVHLVRSVSGDPSLANAGAVDAASVAAGIALSRWFGHEARRVYAMFGETDDETADRKLIEWIRRRGGRVTVREVQQGHRRFTCREAAHAALEQLVRTGAGVWDTTNSGLRGGRPSEVFALGATSAVEPVWLARDSGNGSS